MSKQLSKIEKVGFILRPDSPEIFALYDDIKSKFENKSIEVFLDENSAKMIGIEGVGFDTMCKDVDLLVSLGGDGTLLGVVRCSYGYDKPVLGINAGNLGFLADIPVENQPTMVTTTSNPTRYVTLSPIFVSFTSAQ